MSFNALSIAKLGVGFGALAVASIGLLSPTEVPNVTPSTSKPHTVSVSGALNYPLLMAEKVYKEDYVDKHKLRLIREDEELILIVQSLLINNVIT
jgi:hypothetical protein